MTSSAALARLCAVQGELRALVADLDDTAYRAQFHPDLSPLGWHLGHCSFIENYWLREVVGSDPTLTESLARFYVPTNSHKPDRGLALPDRAQLLAEVRYQQDGNLRLLSEAACGLDSHPLMENDYLVKFLVQHHAQHIETMYMVRTQRALTTGHGEFTPVRSLSAAPVMRAWRTMEAGRYWIGGRRADAFDNELPAHRTACETFRIGARPVTNAEYLGFINDDAYHKRQYWSEAGWRFRQDTGATHPQHWRWHTQHGWFGIGAAGAHALSPETPVYGIGYHEAQAFAAYANARLPHEYEWEIARRAGLLERVGHVWEWCDNAFHSYAGFEPFPYDEYSLPWFSGTHYTLRGASRYTRPDVKRISFRNFYTPEKRHIFAGLRLAF